MNVLWRYTSQHWQLQGTERGRFLETAVLRFVISNTDGQSEHMIETHIRHSIFDIHDTIQVVNNVEIIGLLLVSICQPAGI